MDEQKIANLRVVELSSGVAPSYAAKLLADQGADVIKIEPPEGDTLRHWGQFRGKDNVDLSGYFIALNLNKKSFVLPFERSAVLSRLLQSADILVHGFSNAEATRLGVDAASLTDVLPRLVTLSITPFGRIGPYADYAATDLTLSNAGGWANLCPATQSDPDLPPLKVTGDQCMLMSAIAGAAAALAVWRDTQRTGRGDFIDFSMQAYVASVLESAIPAYSYKEEVPTRNHTRALVPWRIFQAKDAPIFIVCIEQDQWERLVDLMGTPDWTQMETFTDQTSRRENQDLVHMLVQEFVAGWDAAELYHAAQKKRICVAPVLNLEQFADSEHLRARRFFTELQQPGAGVLEVFGSSILGTRGRAPVYAPAPQIGEHNATVANELNRLNVTAHTATRGPANDAQDKPLGGIRVLDMTWAWAGPFCSLNLAHLGAEVIRIESELRADLYRRLPIYPVGIEQGLNCSGMFNQWNQGKSSIAINLGTEEGIEIVKALVAESDIVVQNFATGVMDRMGIGYDTLKSIKPNIIVASISGYGQSGPYKDYMGYGPAIPPLTGLSAGTGYLGGEPEEIGLSMPDPTAGITAAYAITSALIKRDQSGVGEHLDVSLWEATAVLNMEAWMGFAQHGTEPKRMGNRHPNMSPHGVFKCAGDDRWISIACRDDQDWLVLANLINTDLSDDPKYRGLADRQAHEDELESLLAIWTEDQDRWDLTYRLQAKGIPAFPTLTVQDIVEDPHLNEQDFIEHIEHPEVGARAHTGIPWRLHRRKNGIRSPAPCLGADTDAILTTVLGMSEQKRAMLYQQGTIGC
jgi:crotonobetainyl-CoA:carnitine CoA-transferase CaiB-like acyl-CoA transferase